MKGRGEFPPTSYSLLPTPYYLLMLADALQGAKRPSQLITWTDEDGNPVDLTGATITARIRNAMTREARDVDGSFSATDPTAGVFRWDYGVNDVETAGNFTVQFTAAFGSEPTPTRTLKEEWTVHEAF